MPLVCSFYLAAAYVDQLLNLRSPTDHSVLSDTRRMERHLNHLHLFQQMIIYFHRVLHALTTSPRHWEGHRLVQLGWSLDPLLKYLPPRWWALAKIPLFSSEETSWPGPPVNDCRKELTPLLQSGWNQEMSDFAPSPFSIRETWILTQVKMFLWDTSPPSSQSAGFLNKVALPCPIAVSHLNLGAVCYCTVWNQCWLVHS